MRGGCRRLLPVLLLLAEAAAPVTGSGGGAGGGRGGGAGSPRGPGEPCGVYTPGCARGLRCTPRPGERAPLRALLRGTGLCRPPRAPPAATGTPAGDTPQEGPPPHTAPAADVTEELETAPCRGHLAAVLQELRAGLYRTAAAIFLPNCDTRGFYRPQQCRASRGPQRGQCWCVDRRGHPLGGPGGHGGAPRCPPPEGAAAAPRNTAGARPPSCPLNPPTAPSPQAAPYTPKLPPDPPTAP
ncbi:LOW QUALITY PROTEIN: insulin-like growth factor-binding protein 6 [Morus bassanus]